MTDRELLDRKGHEVNDDLPPLPDQYDAAAHMYPWDIEDFQTGEKTGVVFSIPVGCPDGKSVPLWTSEQMRAYARAAVLAERERCAKVCEADPDAVFSAIWKSLVIPGEFDAMDETDKNRWRGVIMQAIGFTAELKAAAIRGVKT